MVEQVIFVHSSHMLLNGDV